MADIAMCLNSEACPSKEKCYRNTATPNEYRQSYSSFASMLQKGDDKCLYFWLDERKEDSSVQVNNRR